MPNSCSISIKISGRKLLLTSALEAGSTFSSLLTDKVGPTGKILGIDIVLCELSL